MNGASMDGSEILTAFLIFIGIMALSSLIFGGWVVVSVLKGIGNVLFGTSKRLPQTAMPRQQARPNPTPQYVAPTLSPPHTQQTLGAPLNVKGSNTAVVGGGIPCQGHGCRQINPVTARYCRRCGHPISQATAAAQRRVAMW